MAENKDTELLSKRLDAIIGILLETSRPDGKEIQMKERIRILYNSGLRPIEIARILGIGITNVSTVLGDLRKKKRLRR